MEPTFEPAAVSELAAAYFQLFVTLALGVTSLLLHRRHQKPYFLAWAGAWGVYALRMAAIISFMHTTAPIWLYWHQVLTGWTALALLWAAVVFWRRVAWRRRYLLLLLFPLLWSYLAIYRLDNFLLAAGPAVAFLSLATLATAAAFFAFHRDTGSRFALWVSIALGLWGLHHLDYPFLRARGIWNPWGYYLDIGFELALGFGILFLVIEDLGEGLRALSSLSDELQPHERSEHLLDDLVARCLDLRAVRGAALFLDAAAPGAGIPAVSAAGDCARWATESPPGGIRDVLVDVLSTGHPQVAAADPGTDGAWLGGHRFVAALPVLTRDTVAGSLIVVGNTRDPFTALDTSFLVALGRQVGAALDNADLTRRLEARTDELERLQTRMVARFEEERERLSRELHDETAQILAAVQLRLGVIAEAVPEQAASLDTIRSLVGETIQSIRGVTRNLRPVALDDLGLLASLRAMARQLSGGDGSLEVAFDVPPRLPELRPDTELALYRTAQEAMANAIRHGHARALRIGVALTGEAIELIVDDNGRGFPEGFEVRGNSRHTGLAGIRERVLAEGGELHVSKSELGGGRVRVRIPLHSSNLAESRDSNFTESQESQA